MTASEVRQITDSRVLAAMAHPLRRRLMDVLKLDGPATVGMVAERTGQAVGSVSHHLRVLATADLIEQVPELARDRRERWWRLASPTLRWSIADVGNDPAAVAVGTAAESVNLDHQIAQVRGWFAAGDDEHAAWGEAPFSVDGWLRLTPRELAELGQQMIDLVHRWSERDVPDDGEPREPVFVFARGLPGRP